ncbi:MAG TPA: MBL fold metallo-hydrolase [Croceibacterium sp.]|nr:MBL fold metallo-hydrolase [Croceibacterium sp.]
MNYRPYLFGGAIALSLAGAAIAQQQPNWDAIQVTATEIRPGVAVLFGNGGNIGVSYGEDGTFIVDDQFAPLAPKVQAAIAGLGASPVKYLVNTHWHFDHAGGNEPFGEAGAIIVAQTRVRDRLAAGGTVAGNTSPPAAKAALPVLTYDHGMTFHMNGDTIDLIHTGGGHTDGDTAVYWRKANVLHTGDMMMKGAGFPFVDLSSGGNVEHLLVSLDQLIAMTNAETVIIPGHGPLATRAELIAWRGMIATAVERVATLKTAGRTLEQAKAAKPVAGLADTTNAFFPEDQFVEAIWASLEAHSS